MTANPGLTPSPRVLGTLFGLRRDAGFAYLGMLPALYVGALPLLLAGCAAVVGRSPLRAPFLACAVACAAAVVGYRWLHLLPIYRLTRFALPWALCLPFFTAVLAGVAWDAMAGATRRRGWIVVTLVAGGVGFAAFGTPAAIAFAAAGIAAGALAGSARTRAVFALVVGVVLADLFSGLPYANGTDPFPPLPRSSTTSTLLREIGERALAVRFLGATEAYTGVAVTERVRTITGLDDSVMPRRLRRIVDHFNLGIAADMPLRLDRVVQSRPLLDAMAVGWVAGPGRWEAALTTAGLVPVVAPSAGVDGLWRNPNALSRAFLVGRARVVSGEEEAFRAVTGGDFRPRDEVVLEEAPPDGAVPPGPPGPGDGARVLLDTGERVRVGTSSSRPALLVVSDTYLPGWEARVDGSRTAMLRANFAFRAVAVPAGEHTVTFTYRPRAFRIGLFASLGGLAVVAAAFAGRRAPRARRVAPPAAAGASG
jgi:hypothetical protein